MEGPRGNTADQALAAVSEDIYAAYRNIDTLTKEVQEERALRLTRGELEPKRLRRCLRHLRTAAFFLHRVAQMPWPVSQGNTLVAATRAVTEATRELLALGPAIEAGARPQSLQDWNRLSRSLPRPSPRSIEEEVADAMQTMAGQPVGILTGGKHHNFRLDLFFSRWSKSATHSRNSPMRRRHVQSNRRIVKASSSSEAAEMKPLDIMWVSLGGGFGSLRWWIGRLISEHYHGAFPLGTFVINISGAFVIGYLSVLFAVDWRDRYGAALNAGVLTGLLGGYTTFEQHAAVSTPPNWAKPIAPLPRLILRCRR